MDLLVIYLMIAFVWTCLFGIMYRLIKPFEGELYPHKEMNTGSFQYVLATGIFWPVSIPVTIYLVVTSIGKD